MKLLDGKIVKEDILLKLDNKIKELDEKIGLAVIQVGDNSASNVYIRQKRKMAENLGYNFNHIKLDSNIREEEIINVIDKLNNDDNIDGILLQLPIPSNLNSKRIINTINPDKDVDGLTDINIGRLVSNSEGLYPCTPSGIMSLLYP